MGKIVFLGAAAAQTKELDTVSFIINSEVKILVETGPSIVRQLERIGLRPIDFDYVCITHMHADHALGFPYFCFTLLQDLKRTKASLKPIKLITKKEIYNQLAKIFEYFYPEKKFDHNMWELVSIPESQYSKKFDKFNISTTSVIHKARAFGIRFEFENAIITYSSDTIYTDKLVSLSKNSNFLIHDGMWPGKLKEKALKSFHSTVIDAAKVAKEARVDNLILVHIEPNHLTIKNELIKEAATIFEGNIIIPSEFEEINFT